MRNTKKTFLERKNVIISFRRYGIDAMSAMALGLFASLLIGTIINTIGQNVAPGSMISQRLLEIGGYATSVTGPVMALAIGHALMAPPLVLYSLAAYEHSILRLPLRLQEKVRSRFPLSQYRRQVRKELLRRPGRWRRRLPLS